VLPGDSGLNLETRQFAKYPIWAVGPHRAAWASGRTVTLAALRDEPLVMLTDEFSLTRMLRQAFGSASSRMWWRRVATGISWHRWLRRGSARPSCPNRCSRAWKPATSLPSPG
jgi:hypothetical protein